MAKTPQNESPAPADLDSADPDSAHPDSAHPDSAHLDRADLDSADLKRLLALAGRVLEEGDVDRLLAAALDGLVELCGAERGIVLLFSTDGEEVASRGRGLERRELEDRELSVSRTVVERVRGTGITFWHENVLEDPELGQAASLYRLTLLSVICCPVHHRGRVLGVVYLDSRSLETLFNARHAASVQRFCQLLSGAAAQALERRGLEARVDELQRRLEAGGRAIVTRDPKMLEMLHLVERVAASAVPVLILGESGSGKELVARAVHDASPRRGEPFVALNCGALPESLLEAQLFGHMRGAFTGAVKDEPGWFQRAGGGTLFLDEVAELPPALQVKLLRVLETGEFAPVGSSTVRHSQARLVAATHQDLEARVADGSLREDFFYRLNVLEVRIPPLRERRADIPLLARHFLDRIAVEENRPPLRLTEAALAVLEAHDYPGNVRELAHALRRAELLSEGDTLDPAGLPATLRRGSASRTSTGLEDGRPGEVPQDFLADDFKSAKARWVERFERAYLEHALERAGGNMSEAARAARLDYKNLFNKVRALGLDPERWR